MPVLSFWSQALEGNAAVKRREFVSLLRRQPRGLFGREQAEGLDLTLRRLRSRGWPKRIRLDHARQAPVITCLNGGRWSLVEEFVEIESGKRE
jgi:hypothetical protein